MPPARLLHRCRLASALIALTLLAGGCFLLGPGRPTPSPVPYAGPPLSIVPMGGEHVVRMTAPSAGWTMRVDDERLRAGGRDVFLTIETPNPAFQHAQGEVVQHLTTRVPAHTPIDVYARVRELGAGGSTTGYRLAARAQPATP